jgi:hypothetical protein
MILSGQREEMPVTDEQFFEALRARRLLASEGGQRLTFEEMRQAGMAIAGRFSQGVADLTPDQLDLLLGWAWASSMECVRRSDPSLLSEGLLAVAIEGGRSDHRDSLVRMAALYHSSRMLEQDPAVLFEQAARVSSDPSFATLLAGFPGRPAWLRDLKAFEISVSSKDGFTYEFFVHEE